MLSNSCSALLVARLPALLVSTKPALLLGFSLVVFGSPDNFRSEKLTFNIAPFRSGYQALLGRTAFARFNAVPHYAYLTLKMPGPRGTIIVSGNADRSLRTEECVAALVAEH